jgi:hypothetical protein
MLGHKVKKTTEESELEMNTRICEDIVLLFAYNYTVVLYGLTLMKDSFSWYKTLINQRYGTQFIVVDEVDYYSIDNQALDNYLYCQANYYIALLLVTWVSPRKKDIYIMTAHHISAMIGTLAGREFDMKVETSMVLFIHDICDVPLQIMTLTHKLKSKFWDVIFYAMFLTAHIILRVIIFPFIAITTTVNHRNIDNTTNWIPISACFPLWCFHVYWAYKLIKIGLKYYKTGKAKDYREKKTKK